MPQKMRDSHKLFLQSFMSRGILDPKEVKALHKNACNRFSESYDSASLVPFVNVINSNIRMFHLEIKKGISEDIGHHCYALVNLMESDFMKLSSDYSVNDLEYLKKLVEHIVTGEGCLPLIEALNLEKDRKTSKKEAQDLLDCFVNDKWLQKNHDGVYALSTRSILELEPFILDKYPDFAVKCNMCKRLCVQGDSCTGCNVKLHRHCSTRLFEGKDKRTCPAKGCGTPWIHDVERSRQDAVPGEQSTSQLSQSQQSQAQPETRKRRTPRH